MFTLRRRFVALATVSGLALVGLVPAIVSSAAGPTPCKNGVTMAQGQSDIDSHPSGTTFCLSGTHNWTLTPKSNDRIMSTGNAVLDGGGSTTNAVVAAPGVSGVSLWFIEIRNYQTQGDAFGAITTPDPPSSNGWVLVGLQVHDNGTGGLGAGAELGTGWVVVGGHWYFNRQEGLTAGGGASNDTITNYGPLVPEIDHNGFLADHVTYGGECGHEAGGFKWVADNVTVTHANIHDNACSGLWDDIDSTGANLNHNTITNNWGEGIRHEISRSASIANNTIKGNGFQTFGIRSGCNTDQGGGIDVADSGRTNSGTGTITISGNTLSGNCNDITGEDSGNSGGICGAECEIVNMHITGNTLKPCNASSPDCTAAERSWGPGPQNNTGIFDDDSDGDPLLGNTDMGNTFFAGSHQCGIYNTGGCP